MKDILLIDDDKLIRQTVSDALRNEGYKVQEASSGPEGLEKLEEKDFDVVILDYKMQPWNGIEVLKRMKEADCDCRVLMLTGFETFEVAAEAIKFGVNTVLTKPVELDRLISEVRRAMRDRVLSRLKKKTKRVKETKEERKPSISERLRPQKTEQAETGEKKNVLVVDDSRVYRKMIINTISSEFKDFNYIEAEDGAVALEKLNEHEDIKVIFLDINMPRMTGIEFMQLKNKSSKFKNIPIVVLTTEKEKKTISKAYLSGATVYVNKPFKREELLKVVKTMLYWHVK